MIGVHPLEPPFHVLEVDEHHVVLGNLVEHLERGGDFHRLARQRSTGLQSRPDDLHLVLEVGAAGELKGRRIRKDRDRARGARLARVAAAAGRLDDTPLRSQHQERRGQSGDRAPDERRSDHRVRLGSRVRPRTAGVHIARTAATASGLLYVRGGMPTPAFDLLPLWGQTQTTEPAPVPGPDLFPFPDWVGIGGGGVLGLLVGLLVWRLLRRRRRRPPKKEEAPALPEAAPPQFRVELPRTELEEAKLREVEEARREADELARQRKDLADAAAHAAAEERARLEAEARALKEREEEAKREEYRAKKALEREERERHRREREEEERLRREAEEKARQAEEARRQAELEEERRRIQAQAGRTLAEGLDKTRQQGFMARLNHLFGQTREVDESVLAELEEALFTADIGVRTASNLVDVAREKAKHKELSSPDKMKTAIRQEIERIVDLPEPPSLEGGGPPHVVMVVGVNGSGKTTTIGKLASKLTRSGKKVVLAAGDTYRAAATEQLDVWADRARAELVKGSDGADPGAVVFDAVKRAQATGSDVVIADTAGRLHTRTPLMEELKKVKRVLDKAQPGAPHEVLLVLDATTGQNAIQQARQFHDAVGVTAIALTKLDGTAKGGVIIGICDELKLPVAWVGVGETIEDLRRFQPKEFVSALFD
jgi:fused signal recognition particle receptor